MTERVLDKKRKAAAYKSRLGAAGIAVVAGTAMIGAMASADKQETAPVPAPQVVKRVVVVPRVEAAPSPTTASVLEPEPAPKPAPPVTTQAPQNTVTRSGGS